MNLLIATTAAFALLISTVSAGASCTKPFGSGYCHDDQTGDMLRCSTAKPCKEAGHGCIFHWGQDGPPNFSDSYANCS